MAQPLIDLLRFNLNCENRVWLRGIHVINSRFKQNFKECWWKTCCFKNKNHILTKNIQKHMKSLIFTIKYRAIWTIKLSKSQIDITPIWQIFSYSPVFLSKCLKSIKLCFQEINILDWRLDTRNIWNSVLAC